LYGFEKRVANMLKPKNNTIKMNQRTPAEKMIVIPIKIIIREPNKSKLFRL
jgi:hypothetical protein